MTKATIATDKGAIEIELYTKSAPKAAANFIELARKGFYDGVVFHRLVPGFVIQGGDGEYGHIDRLNRGRLGTEEAPCGRARDSRTCGLSVAPDNPSDGTCNPTEPRAHRVPSPRAVRVPFPRIEPMTAKGASQ